MWNSKETVLKQQRDRPGTAKGLALGTVNGPTPGVNHHKHPKIRTGTEPQAHLLPIAGVSALLGWDKGREQAWDGDSGCHSPTQGVPEAAGLQALNSPESVASFAATWTWWRLPGSRSVRMWDVTSYGPTWGQQGQGQAGHNQPCLSLPRGEVAVPWWGWSCCPGNSGRGTGEGNTPGMARRMEGSTPAAAFGVLQGWGRHAGTRGGLALLGRQGVREFQDGFSGKGL